MKLRERLRDKAVDRPKLAAGPGRTGLEPGEIEQVPDEAVEPLRLEPDGLQERAAIVPVE